MEFAQSLNVRIPNRLNSEVPIPMIHKMKNIIYENSKLIKKISF